jgi:two-component system nitrate/nitrite response regulator NarL
MSLESVYEEQLLPIARDPLQKITTLLFCKNSLIRVGVAHIFSGSQFVVSEEIFESASKLPEFPASAPVLCILTEIDATATLAGLVADLRAQCPSVHVVVLADDVEPAALVEAYQAGLSGVCSTAMSRDALIKALELVMMGETFIPVALALRLRALFRRSEVQPCSSNSPAPAAETVVPPSKLSAREAEILHCLMEGSTNKSIARKFDVAEATIKVHVKAILRKIKAANRTQAAMWATRHLRSIPGDELEASGA